MAVDISTELAAILAAIYGEEVRGSIHDALLKMNNNLNTAIGSQLLTIDDTLTATDPHAAADSKKVGDVIQTISGLVAFNYNPASSYAVGDYCSYGYSPTTVGHIYRCTTAINGGEAWNPDHWVSIDFSNRIGEIIKYLFNKIATIYDPTHAYAVGDFCTYGNNKSDPGRIYRCNTAIGSGGEAWNASHWTLVDLADVVADVEDEISDLKGELKAITGNQAIPYTLIGNYYRNANVGQVVSFYEPEGGSPNFDGAYLQCSPGDVFTINGKGGNNGRLWSFLNANKEVTRRETDTTNIITNKLITAEEGEVWLVINNRKADFPDAVSYYGKMLVNSVNELETAVDTNTETIANHTTNLAGLNDFSLMYRAQIAANDDMNTYTQNGIYLISMTSSDYATLTNAPSRELLPIVTGLWLEVRHNSSRADRGIIIQRITGAYNTFNTPNACVSRYGNYDGSTIVWYDWTVECYSAVGVDQKIAFINDTIQGLHDDIEAVDTDVKNIATAHINLYNYAEFEDGYVYKASGGKVAIEGCSIASPIPIKANITYYIRNTRCYFSWFMYDDGTHEKIGSSDSVRGGAFTPTKSGHANLTINTDDKQTCVFTEDQTLYNSGRTDIYYSPNKLELNESGTEVQHVFRVGETREYTLLLEGIIAAEEYKNSIVYVDPGTYDMTQEFKDKYGNDYFSSTATDFTTKSNFRGCPLTNGVHVIGYGGVTVTGGLLSTDNPDAISWWSIFNGGDDAYGDNGYGFTIENITIKSVSQHIRYLVHDEYGGTDYDYINKYINIHFVVFPGYVKRCIGGGLGKHGYILIDNCTVDAPAYDATIRGINYHNDAGVGALNEIYIKNCYIPNGTVGITWYGQTPATEKSMLYVNNCYLQAEPVKKEETASAPYENVDIVSWCNTIVP